MSGSVAAPGLCPAPQGHSSGGGSLPPAFDLERKAAKMLMRA